MNVEQARFNMIEQQIRPWDVLDPAVLSLLSSVHREDFVPEAHRAQALMDLEIPLDNGRALLAPRVEARLVQDLSLAKEETALLIGAATGYMAALMAHLAQRVVAIDSDAALVSAARANLKKAGIGNVEVAQADGTQGYTLNDAQGNPIGTGTIIPGQGNKVSVNVPMRDAGGAFAPAEEFRQAVHVVPG